jgi:hypothetical protein
LLIDMGDQELVDQGQDVLYGGFLVLAVSHGGAEGGGEDLVVAQGVGGGLGELQA